MSKIPAILSATLTATLAACAKDHTPIGQPYTTPLVTSSAVSVGTLTVFNSTDGLFITATPGSGWELKETRLSVSRSADGIPQSKSCDPNVDRFLLRKTKADASGAMAYALPLLVPAGTELFIALYAKLRPATAMGEAAGRDDGRDGGGHDGDRGDDSGTTSAWAQGTLFSAKSDAMYLSYTVRAAAPPTLVGQFRTYSQEDWGGASQDSSATNTLMANFFTAFPLGATIGSSSGLSAQFTTAQAVLDFLPQSGVPGPLTRSSVNSRDLSNSFAGATLALTLNVGFDAADASFSADAGALSALVIADPASPLYGLSVGEVLATANLHLSGSPDPGPAMLQDVSDAVTRINANFEGGTVDAGLLGRP